MLKRVYYLRAGETFICYTSFIVIRNCTNWEQYLCGYYLHNTQSQMKHLDVDIAPVFRFVSCIFLELLSISSWPSSASQIWKIEK